MKNKVAVLLSTYNGEKYLTEQLNSILIQEDVIVNLYVRDDGSTDNTLKILYEFAAKNINITVFKGENVGFAESFYSLLKMNIGADYYAFSDQDDIWEKNKLITAIKSINNSKKPMLYYSNLNVFDMVNNSRYYLYNNEYVKKYFSRYFYIYNGYGCTMVWNSELMSELKKLKMPKGITHDIWVNLVANSIGNSFYDSNSYINYRVHGGNACGVTPNSFYKKLKKIYTFYFKNKKQLCISLNCSYIINHFDMKDSLIKSIANYKEKKIHFIFSLLKADLPKNDKLKFILLATFGKL